MRQVLALLVLSVLVTGCTPKPSVSPSASSPSSTASTLSPTSSPTPNEQFVALDRIVLHEPSALGPAWSELFALPYGDAPDRLGTSPGGEGVTWGPSYGTQLPDETWWFLDAAHLRLAHFSKAGDYLGEAPIPKEYLADGQYVQYQRPLALADGTVVLQSSGLAPGMLLMAPGGSFTRVGLPFFLAVTGTDGTHIYGFDQESRMVRVDPHTGKSTKVAGFAGQAIPEFGVAVSVGRLQITRLGVTLDLPVVAAGRETAAVIPAVEAVAGTDGILNVLVSGIIEEDSAEVTSVLGFVRIDKDGRGLVDEIRSLESPTDPGDGLRLGIRLGDSRPWLMAIDQDAVRVYQREVSA